MDGELLINEVFGRSALWQARHKNHRNRGVCNKLWNEVAEALASSKADVKQRWKNMRDSYRRELSKLKTTKSGDEGGGAIQTSAWPFFELMYFLKEELQPSQKSGNLPVEYVDQEEQVDVSQDDPQSSITDPDNVVIDEMMNSPSCSSRSQTPSSANSQQYVRKRKGTVQDEVAKKMLLLEEEKVKLLKSDSVDQGEDYHFLMSLLPHFKDMDDLQKLNVRNRMIQVIIDDKHQRKNTLSTFDYGPFY